MQCQQAIRILKVNWGVFTNNQSLLCELPAQPAYESLLTDFHRVEQTTLDQPLHGHLVIIDQPDVPPSIHNVADATLAVGPFAQITSQTRDLRYTFFGNEGLVFRRTLELLEDHHDIFSFHACAMFEPKTNTLFVICGSAGSGKSCFLLKGLQLGMQLFSVEMVHFAISDNKLVFHKGALVDNIRIGNLKYNYPFILKKLDLQLPPAQDEWGKKIAVDLTAFQVVPDELVDPNVVIILPRVEEGRQQHFCQEQTDHRKVARPLFENAGEKIGQSMLLYETIPFVALDTPQAAQKRLQAITALLAHKQVANVLSIVSGPNDCWKGLTQ